MTKSVLHRAASLWSVVLLLILIQGCDHKQQPDQQEISRARAVIQDHVDKKGVVGLSVTIMKEGEILWSEGFGYANLETGTKVDPEHSLFRIGSISKPITSTALALLVEEGKVNLEDDVRKYVEYFPEKEYPFNVRQLASHTAGIRHYKGGEFLSQARYATVREGLTLFQDDPLLFKPGERYRYSSYGYNLLSAIVEEASGETFLGFVKKRVFEPAGLRHTSPDYADSVLIGRGGYYEFDSTTMKTINATYVDNSYKWGGGGFLASTNDVARFGWAFHTGKVVKPETRDLFITRQTLNNGDTIGYGLGWVGLRKDSRGRLSYGHNGGSVGGQSILRIYPEHGLVVAIVKNTSNDGGYGNLLREIVDIFLPEP